MAVRIVGEETRTHDDVEETATTPKKNPWKWIIIAATTLLLVVALVLAYALSQGRTPQPTPTPNAPAPATQPGTGSDAIPPSNANNQGQIPGVPGLWRGTATVTSGNKDTLHGVPIKWPKTVDGAVGAAINYHNAMSSITNMLPATYPAIDNQILSKAGHAKYASTPESAKRDRDSFPINENGVYLMNGTPTPEVRVIVSTFPRYAAYQVLENNVGDGKVTVRVWSLRLGGTGTEEDMSAVKMRWEVITFAMVWENNDWRIDDMKGEGTNPPKPTIRRSNTPYPEVRKTLGPGWLVPADGTDQPYPGAVMTK